MKTNHHPDQSTLINYAAGSLPDSLSLVVACHLAECQHCRQIVAEAESFGCHLMDELTPSAMSENARDNILAMLDESVPKKESSVVTNLKPNSEVPEPLQPLIGERFSDLHWRSMAPGMKQFILPATQGQLRLLKISPGTCMPVHGHTGSELTIVLKGSYNDELGRFCPGDVADLDPDVKHQPVVDGSQECICLIATDGPLKFVGIVPRLLQPFFRI